MIKFINKLGVFCEYVYKSTSSQSSSLLRCDNVVEFVEVEVLVGFGVVYDVRVVHQLSQLIIVQSFSQLLCDSLEIVEPNDSRSFVVPKFKNFG